MAIIDVIFLMISLFAAYRLYTVLGQRTEKGKSFTNTGTKAQNSSEKQFIKGATHAFEMTLKAFLQGDLDALGPLLSTKLYQEFEKLIKNREKKKQIATLDFFRHISTTVIESEKGDGYMKNVVKFRSEQTLIVRNHNGKLLEGDPAAVEEITDIWVFERSVKNENPNWILVDIKASE